MTTEIKAKEKISSLQGLRTIAFLMVFLLHTGLTDTGEIGVSLFFVLSGFVMYLNYKDRELNTSFKGLFDFSIQKVKKLYPLHVITMLFFLYFEIKILVEAFDLHKLIETVWHVILNLTLLQVWAPMQATHMSLNGVSWFYAVCLFLYLCFPLINKKVKSYRSIKSAVVAIVITLGLMAASAMIVTKIPVSDKISSNFIKWFTYVFPLYRLGDFVIGSNLAYIYDSVKRKSPDLNPVVASILELLAIFSLPLIYELRRYGIFIFGNNFVRYNLVYLPSAMAVVFLLAFGQGIVSKLLSLKPVVFIGDISSFAFLIHSVVIKYYFDLFISSKFAINPWFSTPVIFAITILLSYLFSLCSKRSRKVK